MSKKMSRRTFLRRSAEIAGGCLAWRSGFFREGLAFAAEGEAAVEGNRNMARLDQTRIRNSNIWRLVPFRGRVDMAVALYVPKDDPWLNYGWRLPGVIPGDYSMLMYNVMRGADRFGTRVLRPGETLTYMDLVRTPEGEMEDAESIAYFGPGSGLCHLATALGEVIFGTLIRLPDGRIMPLCVAPRNGIQPHYVKKNPYYYYSVYGPTGEGVAVNESKYGQLRFGVNPYLPEDITATITLSYVDTRPLLQDRRVGEFRTTSRLAVTGLPEGARVFHQRFTENRRPLLEIVEGSDNPMRSGSSPYFDENGQMRTVTGFSANIAQPEGYVDVIDRQQVIFESFLRAAQVPAGNANVDYFPDGFSRHGNLGPNGMTWNHADDWLYLAEADLPAAMNGISAGGYHDALAWFNYAPDNARYKAEGEDSYCTVFVKDLAQACRYLGYPYSAPVPGWYLLPGWYRPVKLNANKMVRWFHTDDAHLLGWRQVDVAKGEEMANLGLPTIAMMQAATGFVGHLAALAPGSGRVGPDGKYYPRTANVGKVNWGPDDGRTAYESFSRLLTVPGRALLSEPEYFTWVPPRFPLAAYVK